MGTGIAAIRIGWIAETAIATWACQSRGRAWGPLSHPDPGHTYLQQHAENVPADDKQFSRGCRHCRHGSECARWVVESVCRRRPRVCRGPLVSRSPLLGALLQPPRPRLKYPPATQLRMRAWGGSIRRGSRGHSSFVRRGKKIIHLLFPPTPASRVSSYPFPEYSAVPAFEF